ncbi:DUF2188 domain-containing protein [Oceanobacillus massiliensis]|uniref:DUF2188 domain-containing protein n=1 Tax=Oceanobacillus massiliensis TaxID=1465765 RepID=UPI000289A45C|nr:DUF2188 domain-containing protein [Oceanobacillus massiliensis]
MANDNNQQNEYFEDRAGSEDARFHVVPHDDKGWAVKREGEDDPELTTGSKEDAVSKAKELAKDASTMAIIHDDDGKIEDQLNFES